MSGTALTDFGNWLHPKHPPGVKYRRVHLGLRIRAGAAFFRVVFVCRNKSGSRPEPSGCWQAASDSRRALRGVHRLELDRIPNCHHGRFFTLHCFRRNIRHQSPFLDKSRNPHTYGAGRAHHGSNKGARMVPHTAIADGGQARWICRIVIVALRSHSGDADSILWLNPLSMPTALTMERLRHACHRIFRTLAG